MILDRLLGLFSSDITIDLARERITFTSGMRSISLLPVVYVQRSVDGLRVLGVGERVGDLPSDVVEVELFTTAPLPPGVADRFEMLEAFFRYGVQKLMNRRVLVRPAIVIHGLSNLSPVMNGYERGLLSRAAESAGARGIHFA
jgi:hypothetical protein